MTQLPILPILIPLVAGAILAGFGGPWPIWALLLLIGIFLPLRRK